MLSILGKINHTSPKPLMSSTYGSFEVIKSQPCAVDANEMEADETTCSGVFKNFLVKFLIIFYHRFREICLFLAPPPFPA